MEHDLLNLPYEVEKRRHKLKRTIPAPNSYFLRIKCKRCEDALSVVFSNAQSNQYCLSCNQLLAKCTGGKVKIQDGVEYQVIGHSKPKNSQRK